MTLKVLQIYDGADLKRWQKPERMSCLLVWLLIIVVDVVFANIISVYICCKWNWYDGIAKSHITYHNIPQAMESVYTYRILESHTNITQCWLSVRCARNLYNICIQKSYLQLHIEKSANYYRMNDKADVIDRIRLCGSSAFCTLSNRTNCSRNFIDQIITICIIHLIFYKMFYDRARKKRRHNNQIPIQ